MVVVYLKNGEKAPLPDANYVRLEGLSEDSMVQMLRCFFGNTEVGQFKWDEVAGYTVSASRVPDQPLGTYDAWAQRLQA